MTITTDELINGIELKNGFPLDGEQKQAIIYENGPLLIAAGPGTGKTEVLVSRCLKFICCDGVNPGSIMLTTFTQKAAKNLEDRLTDAFMFLNNRYPQLSNIDLSSLRIGTLHGLCNDILQEYRYTEYQNLRLLDEMESALLVHRLVVDDVDHLKGSLLNQFGYLFGNKPFQNKWDWASRLIQIFDRLVEDEIDLNALQGQGNSWDAVYEANEIYEQLLASTYSCDFSHLLQYFRDFLETGQGETFLQGSGDSLNVQPPLTHILVDEYQDTNPIQESIYFRLCDSVPHNITVVGDDDQALYRFRGGTVECMVGFPSSCQTRWGITPNIIYLHSNHRSDSEIVDWCNSYITSYPLMSGQDVRIKDKPPLTSSRGSTGSHPSVGLIRDTSIKKCAPRMADLVKNLKHRGMIEDYSQCVLLLRSTKNTPRYAGPYYEALQSEGIPVYNPRSRDYLEQPEVAQCLGAFISIIDPGRIHLGKLMSPSTRNLVRNWISEYDSIASTNPSLADYVKKGAEGIASRNSNELITAATSTILYRILSHQPFAGYQQNPEMDLRLSKLTRIFESFCSQYGRELWTDTTNTGELPGWWYGNFYYGLCGYLTQSGLNEDEDEEVVSPEGYFPIMTVHQAKGLEFDFVFVGNLGSSVWDSPSHYLEQDLRHFRRNPPNIIHSIKASQWQDDIRQHFVAFSRAKYSLILVASTSQLRNKPNKTASFGGQGGGWVQQRATRL